MQYMISHKRFLVGGISDYLLEHTWPELIVRPSSILFVLWSKQTRNDLSEICLLDVHSQYNCGPIIFSGPTDIEKQLCL